jgi:hypothetical protein
MRLNTLVCVLPAFCLSFAPSLLGQDGAPDMSPAPQVKSFHKLLGTWNGAGTVRTSAEDPGMKWTATTHNTSVLGGHFVQQKLKIVFQGEQAPPVLAFRTIYGYDKETKKWMSYSIDNTGGTEANEIHWVNGKMMSGGSKTEMDMNGKLQFIVQRWTRTFSKNSYTIAVDQTVGDGKHFAHVTGSFTRASAIKVASASYTATKIPAMAPVAKQMAPVAKWHGKYRLKGWMIMAQGMPKMDIGGVEVVKSIFGGTILDLRFKGDPIPNAGSAYEGWGTISWSAHSNCYKRLYIDNMGGAVLHDLHLRDGKFVGGALLLSMGQPVVISSVMTLNDDGSKATFSEHKAFGTSAPIHASYFTYKKQ